MYPECLYLITNHGYIIIYVIASQTHPDDQSLTIKLLERVLEKRIRCHVPIDNMQFGFMPGKGTTDAIFIMPLV